MKTRRILLIMLVFGLFFTLFGCSEKDSGKKDIFYAAAIVTEFEYQGKKYVSTYEHDTENEFNCFFGYFINASDLEKWQNYDQDNNLVYVLDSHNSLYRADIDKFINRFEIYSMEGNTDAFAISYTQKIIYRVEV
ncbi:MAG: hypothetical protein K2O22_03935 [Anaeroplasmataceae bacterium]|nr:hypothetical protein [Anaeroplasmataceae bacterium]